MKPINHPLHPPNTGSRRKPDLSLPVPQRQPSLPVPLPLPLPLPLPPPSAAAAKSSSATQSASMSQIPPLTLADLDREGRIGSGSGGTVYKVRHRSTGTSFALKVIYGNHEDSIRLRIRREIEILRSVDNPNVVKCHALFDNAGEIQVLLEYMDRGSLEGTRISDESFLADVARQVLSGLSYLHRRRIVHRDIKPSNFLINSQSIVKIADFGVSRTLLRTMDPCESSVGTIAYMSPERINTDLNDGVYDGCAGDIWSFGVSMLEFYMGRFPFDVGKQNDWASLMCAICMSKPPEPPASVSQEFRHFVACCLQRDPANRWTALQLLQHPFILHSSVSRNAQQQVYRPPRLT